MKTKKTQKTEEVKEWKEQKFKYDSDDAEFIDEDILEENEEDNLSSGSFEETEEDEKTKALEKSVQLASDMQGLLILLHTSLMFSCNHKLENSVKES